MMLQTKHKKGSAIVYALIMVSIIAIILVGIVTFVVSQLRFSLNAEPQKQALHSAEAGLYFYRWYLAHNVDGQTADEVELFWADTTNPAIGAYDTSVSPAVAYDCLAGEGDVFDYPTVNPISQYRICIERPSFGSTIVQVYITGWTLKKPEIARTVSVRMRRPAWSEFVILSDLVVDLENASQTVVTEGKVHANGGVRFDSDGTAFNVVSSSVDTYNNNGSDDGVYTTGDPTAVFLGGRSFPAPQQQFSSVIVNFGQMFAKADELRLDYPSPKKIHVHLNADGTADICKIKKIDNVTKEIKQYEISNPCETKTLPNFAVLYVNNDIWIDGTLADGYKLSLSAFHNGQGQPRQHTIYINGDLTHNSDSGSVLGIVAENDIEIIEDPIGTSFRGDHNGNLELDIDAALLSQGGQLGRSADFATMGDVNIFGAIATQQGVSLNGIGDFTVTFDQNLIYNPPPYFPTGNTYIIDAWEEITL